MRTLFLIIALLGSTTQYWHSHSYRLGAFKDHWGVVSEKAYSFPEDHATVKPLVLMTPAKRFRAVATMSDVRKVPYDQAMASIEIERFNGTKKFLIMRGFRKTTARWLNDRLLYIDSGLGHAAGLEQIYDAEAGKWIYQQGVSYSKFQYPQLKSWELREKKNG